MNCDTETLKVVLSGACAPMWLVTCSVNGVGAITGSVCGALADSATRPLDPSNVRNEGSAGVTVQSFGVLPTWVKAGVKLWPCENV